MRQLLQQFKSDTLTLFKLAFPLMMAQLGHLMLQVVDAAMIGRVGVDSLAAAAFGTNVTHLFMLFGFGLNMSIHIFVSRDAGRGEREKCGQWLMCGLLISFIFALLCALGFSFLHPMLAYFGQTPEVVELSKPYVLYLAWSFIPMLLHHCLKNYSEALAYVWLPFVVLVLGFVLNVLLNWVLIYGKLGFPEMGLEGAGLATLLARMFMMLLMGVLVWRCGMIAGLKGRAIMTVERMKKMLSVGIPGAFQVLFEAGAFVFSAIMMGWIGVTTQAAHHIAITYAAAVFMLPLGMSFATCILVGNAIGRGDVYEARRIGWNASICAVLMMTLAAVLTALLRNDIPYWFTGDSGAEAKATAAIASGFLLVVAMFHIFDGAQAILLGALRGLADVYVPALLMFIIFWVVGLPCGWYLAFDMEMGGMGIWYALMGGLIVLSLVLPVRFHFRTRRIAKSETF